MRVVSLFLQKREAMALSKSVCGGLPERDLKWKEVEDHFGSKFSEEEFKHFKVTVAPSGKSTGS